ncbi:TPA: phage tail protein [Enterobacter cloacae subsp. cloacae]|uniref:phage tail fiber protein n=1 Tax=Enterobacter cloacae TaxID=550 RepID=UPI0018C2DE05|nr:phage tail protein [Enterobacter cloacae]MBG0521236.1 phage tail protein [Enterobacter cloacae]HCM9439998.1 phage tail protein [Enterobacter cloacae subsp. cloacae]
MSAGTLTLTNNSAAVTGSGTAFTTELAAGDFVVVTVGGIPYTLAIKTVNSNTSLTLVSSHTGPTQAGAAWYAVPRVAMNLVTAALVAQSAEALRGLNYDKQNWQSIFSGTGNVTVTLPDGSSFTGPAWNSFTQALNGKADKVSGAVPVNQGGTGATTAESARTNLGLGSSATRNAYSSTGDMLSVGDFGLGSTSAPGLNDANLGRQTAFSGAGGAGAVNFFDAYSPLLSMVRTTSIAVQMQITAAGKSAVRGCNAGNWTSWYELYSTQNTTKSSDGTLKAASPVVKVFFDGTYETNDESAGVKVTKIATGEYLVEGCEGLNSDAAWSGIDGGFDIPIDRNKQPLIWLDYEVHADGSVLVKTYHRTHPGAPEFARNELDGVSNGDPVDIPRDQFVSVRVEMPADSLYNQKLRAAELAMTTDEDE